MNFLDFKVGDGNKILIIAEAGINHQGSLDMALKMVQIAKECGADIIKFQKRDMSSLYREDVLKEPSKYSHSLGIYIPILKDCELSQEHHVILKKACDNIGIKYLCSPWDISSVDFLESLNVEGYKIPSACLDDYYLMEAIEKTGKPVIISLGMHTEDEIYTLLQTYKEMFENRMILMHCISSYPTANKDVNLGYIKKLKEVYKCPVGYSGHERGVPISIASIAFGANVIERHFTLDRTLQGPDHASSLESHGLETLVRHVRAVEEAMGDKKEMNQGEIMARETIGKIVTWARNHLKGEIVSDDSFCFTSPGYGISACDFQKLIRDDENVGFVITHNILAKQPFQIGDIEKCV